MSKTTLEMCDSYAPIQKRYEEAVEKYFEVMGISPIPRHLDAHFWEMSEQKLPKGTVLRACKFGAIGAVVGAILAAVFTFINESEALYINYLVNALICAVIGIMVGALFAVLCGVYQKACVVVPLVKLEKKLESCLRRLPPRYRNLFCLAGLYDIYATYGIDDMRQAFAICDKHMQTNKNKFPGITYMTNLDYREEGDEEQIRDKKAYEYKPNMRNPAMPKDIEAHLSEAPEDAEAALNELIGLEDVKDQVRKMRSRMEFYGKDKKDVSGAHMLFLGPAGTGKTTVARIMTRILYDLGYIKRSKIVEVDGDYLKSPNPGMTGERVSAIIDFAHGGVLFIDEAYLLAEKGAAGAEATGVLLKAMEDLREDVVIILAGYEDAMTKLIATNEGFASRIKHKIRFSAYDADSLAEVFEFMMQQSFPEYDLENDARKALVAYFEEVRSNRAFGNARESRNALSAIADIHADRVVSGAEKRLKTFTKQDVLDYIDERRKSLTQDVQSEMAALDLDSAIISYAEAKAYVKTAQSGDVWVGHVASDERKRDVASACAKMLYGTGILVITGNSGCGKTDLIEPIVRELNKLGAVSTLRYVSLTSSLLKGAYVGHTSRRVNALCSFAAGGVLFVDDASAVLTDPMDAFGQEAISTLATNADNGICKIVIAADRNELNGLFAKAPQLQAKCQSVVELEEYSPKELCYVMNIQADKRGFKISEDVWAHVGKDVAYLANATEAISLLDLWCAKAHTRNSKIIDVCDVR